MQVCFHYTVLLFGLAVNLWIKAGKKLLFDGKEVTKQELELRDENCSSITDDKVKKAIVLYNHVGNYLHKA